MGPVSFNPIRCRDRKEALELARSLTRNGIRFQMADRDTTVLVSNDDLITAQRMVDQLRAS